MRGKAPAPKDTITDLLYPTHGVREELTRRGLKPRDHRLDNRRYIRELQQKVNDKREALAARETARLPGKREYKVTSRVTETISRPATAPARRQPVASAQPKNFMCGKNFGGRGSAWLEPPLLQLSEAELQQQAETPRRAKLKPGLPQKASAHSASARNVDFVKRNTELAGFASPRTGSATARKQGGLGAAAFMKGPSHGKLPAYLLDR